jgi:hypothetical protein
MQSRGGTLDHSLHTHIQSEEIREDVKKNVI